MDPKNKEVIKEFIRELSEGDTLFDQGQMGNTMFVVIEGEIDLYEETAHGEIKIGTLGPGEVLGEKVILSTIPYPRAYKAKVKTATSSLLEFAAKDIKLVETVVPDLSLRILKMAEKRLDRANRMISFLRSIDPLERLVRGLVFLCDDLGKKTAIGIEIEASIPDLQSLTSVNLELINNCLDQLQQNNLVKKLPQGFLIRDPKELAQYLPDLRERIAA